MAGNPFLLNEPDIQRNLDTEALYENWFRVADAGLSPITTLQLLTFYPHPLIRYTHVTAVIARRTVCLPAQLACHIICSTLRLSSFHPQIVTAKSLVRMP